jgi:hypothetical protein
VTSTWPPPAAPPPRRCGTSKRPRDAAQHRRRAARRPAKSAAAILAALDAERTPPRLPLGHDAVDGVLGHLDAARDELLAREKAGRATGVGD